MKTIPGLFIILAIQWVNIAQTVAADKLIIKGEITGTKNTGKSFKIKLYQKYIKATEQFDASTYQAEIKHNQFRFDINTQTEFNYLQIVDTTISRHTRELLFLMRGVPEINIRWIQGKIRFSGKNSDLLNCQSELFDQMIYVDKGMSMTTDAAYYDNILKRRQTLHGKMDSILNLYKGKIAGKDYKLIRANVISRIDMAMVSLFSLPPKSLETTPYINDLFRQYFIEASEQDKYDDETVDQSFSLAQYIYMLRSLEVNLINRLKSKETSFADLYQSLHTNYSGLLREKALLISFIELYFTKRDAAEYLDRAYRLFTPGFYKKKMFAFINANLPGTKVFPFQFLDTKGKLVKLDDFKGKVAIMDIWFRGCKPCLDLAPHMKAIAEDYKDNKDVVFISLSIDKNKADWRAAYKDYSGESFVNLNVGELGTDQPFFEFYNIRMYPTILLIDKNGRLITISPPRPLTTEKKEAFKRLINQHL